MALSNWDKLLIGPDGTSISGPWTAGPVTLDIHKAEVRLRLAGNDSIITIYRANLYVSPVRFIVEHKTDHVACMVFAYANDTEACCAGLGCYGYEGNNYVGVSPQLLGRFRDWLASLKYEHMPLRYADWLAGIQWNRLTRHNQGDKYFAEHFSCSTPDTVVGEADNTLLSDALRKQEAKGEEGCT